MTGLRTYRHSPLSAARPPLADSVDVAIAFRTGRVDQSPYAADVAVGAPSSETGVTGEPAAAG